MHTFLELLMHGKVLYFLHKIIMKRTKVNQIQKLKSKCDRHFFCCWANLNISSSTSSKVRLFQCVANETQYLSFVLFCNASLALYSLGKILKVLKNFKQLKMSTWSRIIQGVAKVVVEGNTLSQFASCTNIAHRQK